MSPTYELAVQTGEVAAKMAQFCPEILIRYAVRGEEGYYFFAFICDRLSYICGLIAVSDDYLTEFFLD